jgi:tRNA-splicing ligase RtcB
MLFLTFDNGRIYIMSDYKIKKLSDYKWEVQKDEKSGMRVPGIIFADREILEIAKREKTLDQIVNVANLPGILKASFAMPDIHYGYGFPIGGVAAFDLEEGVISPGGVGYDISCGIRLLKTNIDADEISSRLEDIMYKLYSSIPKGVGSKGIIKLSKHQMDKLFTGGAGWAVKQGYGWQEAQTLITSAIRHMAAAVTRQARLARVITLLKWQKWQKYLMLILQL